MVDKEPIVERTIWRLTNALKGQAMMCKDQNAMMATPEEKMAELEVIGQLKEYITHYRENQRKLAEYADIQARLMDDGR